MGQSEVVSPCRAALDNALAELGPATFGLDVVLGTQMCPAMFSVPAGMGGVCSVSFSEQGERRLPPVLGVTYLCSPQVCEPHLCGAQSS